MNLEQGRVISERYEIIEKIGVGGMANVYRAKDLKLDRFVTFKVLKEEFAKDEEFIKRFSVEAQAAARLSHPNIVTVYDVGNEGNINYIVMEFIDGYTLKELIKKKAPFANDEALGVAIQIASALENAHEHGIVHRDIKPQNILVTKDGSIKVTDFGIARAVDSNTITTESMGSVHYFSPEQARGVYVDCKSDIYSLGIVLYEMVTGKLPFDGDSPVQLAMKHMNEPLPDMRALNPNISASVEKIILKATEKVSTQRYQTAEELNNDLKRALTNETGDFVKKQDYAYDDSPTVVITKEDREAINNLKNEDTADFSNEEKFDTLNNATTSYDNYNDNMDYENDIDDENDVDTEYDDLDKTINFSNNPNNPYQSNKNTKAPSYNNYNSYDDEVYKKKEKKVIISAVVTAFILIAVITAVGGWILRKNQAPDVTVPNLIDMSFEDAQNEGAKLRIYINKTAEEYSDEYDEGKVIKQSVDGGKTIKEGESIEVTVSKGPDPDEAEYKIPQLVGLDLTDAEKKLEDILVTVDEEYVYDDNAPLNEIIEQSPEAGTVVKGKTTLKIKISKGAEDTQTTVPNCVGKTEEEATKLLASAGLVVGQITEAESSKYDKGYVMNQLTPAGNSVNTGSKVSLVISSGKVSKEPTLKDDVDDQIPDQKDSKKSDSSSSDDEDKDSESTDKKTNKDNTENSETESKANEATTESGSLVINPTVNDGSETVNIQVLKQDNASSGVSIYSNSVKVSDFPIKVPYKINKVTEFQVYVNGELYAKETRGNKW